MGKTERRAKPPGRRASDIEVYEMSKEALDTARNAAEAITVHVAVCEAQNKDILRRLGVQDKILYGIAAGIGMEVISLIFSHIGK